MNSSQAHNQPAHQRTSARKANTMSSTQASGRKMTPAMHELLSHFATGAHIQPCDRSIIVGDKWHHFAPGSFVGLIDRKYVELTTAIDEDECERRVWVISEAGKTALG
jgi:hypothetical protein